VTTEERLAAIYGVDKFQQWVCTDAKYLAAQTTDPLFRWI